MRRRTSVVAWMVAGAMALLGFTAATPAAFANSTVTPAGTDLGHRRRRREHGHDHQERHPVHGLGLPERGDRGQRMHPGHRDHGELHHLHSGAVHPTLRQPRGRRRHGDHAHRRRRLLRLTLRGEAGADTLNGGSGNDQLNPGDDNDMDTLNGGGDLFGQGDTGRSSPAPRARSPWISTAPATTGPAGCDQVGSRRRGPAGRLHVDTLTGNDGDEPDQRRAGQCSSPRRITVGDAERRSGGDDTHPGARAPEHDGRRRRERHLLRRRTDPRTPGSALDGTTTPSPAGPARTPSTTPCSSEASPNPIDVDLDSGSGNGIDDPVVGDPGDSDTFAEDIENLKSASNAAGDEAPRHEGANPIDQP